MEERPSGRGEERDGESPSRVLFPALPAEERSAEDRHQVSRTETAPLVQTSNDREQSQGRPVRGREPTSRRRGSASGPLSSPPHTVRNRTLKTPPAKRERGKYKNIVTGQARIYMSTDVTTNTFTRHTGPLTLMYYRNKKA